MRLTKTLVSLAAGGLFALSAAATEHEKTVGVIFVVHGGSEETDLGNTFDNTLQFFQYDPNNVIFQRVIWNPEVWPTVVSKDDSQDYANASTQFLKYSFQNARIGGIDPAADLADRQLDMMTQVLEAHGAQLGINFVTDIAHWLGSQTFIHRLPWPRMMYEPQVAGGANLRYCGSETDDGPWPHCSPDRYNVDGPAERLLRRGAEEIIMVDMTTTGVRFWKTYDVVSTTRRVVDKWNEEHGTNVQVLWVNDPTDLMRESFPTDPPGWTRSAGPPRVNPQIPLEGRPNPFIEDPLLIDMMVDGIVASFNPGVSAERTAVLIVNHAIRDGNEAFDPKIDDTVVMDKLIREELLRRYPTMKENNILGAWMGRREENPNIEVTRPGQSRMERTREMRGESLGNAWLYLSDRQLPGGLHGYLYWDALDEFRQREIDHIVVAFTQISIDSVLNLVELPNQIAKEIGWRSWLRADTLDFDTYPEVGHPFAEVWGVWVDTECRIEGDPLGRTGPCCFEMGGCDDGRPYPPPRQTPIDQPRQDTDPSLGWQIPAFGHLGYDQSKGPPSDDAPVQGQYRGTWELWQPLNDDPRVGLLLARQVLGLMTEHGMIDEGAGYSLTSATGRGAGR
ncbi:MAG: hypothetical protein JJT85_02270 [Chromatiales bacterium]|nr:hypothetical protein [Chromatiales bacterium]